MSSPPRDHALEPRRWVVAKAVAVGVVSLLTLGWALHGVDVEGVLEQVRESSPAVISAYLSIQVFVLLLRVFRWWLLVRPLGPASNRLIVLSGMIGIPAAFLLPLRLGELVRPAMLSKEGTPFAGTVAAVVVERVADGAMNVGIFFLLLALLPASAHVSHELRTIAVVALVGFGGALAVLVLAAVARAPVLHTTDRLVRPFSKRGAAVIARLIGTFLDGLIVLGSWRRILAFGLSTAAYWGIHGYSTYFLAASHIPSLPWSAGPFTACVSVFAITIPGGPGAIGTFEAGYRLALAPFGVDPEGAAVVSLLTHGLQLVLSTSVLVLGLVVARNRRP